jgi:hypothetical protein
MESREKHLEKGQHPAGMPNGRKVALTTMPQMDDSAYQHSSYAEEQRKVISIISFSASAMDQARVCRY